VPSWRYNYGFAEIKIYPAAHQVDDYGAITSAMFRGLRLVLLRVRFGVPVISLLVSSHQPVYYREMCDSRFNVHLLNPLDEPYGARLREALDKHIRLTTGDDVTEDTHILVAGVPGREHLEATNQLQAVVIPWAGLSVKTRELLQDFPDLQVYNLHHNASAAAEHAIALLLAAAKNLVPIDRSLHRSDWRPRYAEPEALLLEGHTAVVLGYGEIGRRVARTLDTLGMDVHAMKRTIDSPHDGDISLHVIQDLPGLLPQARVLMVALPLTEETRGLVGRGQLSALPDGTVIVNVARGAIIDEKALYDELKSGRLKAGIDVWYQYPKEKETRANTPPSQYNFGSLSNVVMTPHLAGHTVDTETLRVRELARLLNRLATGDLGTPIDPQRGY
jgi:phosphoglycerate dehydrogenase-like enzyme